MSLLESLVRKTDSKILLVVLDGIGGLPGPGGKTELEAASTPNLDRLAREGSLGLVTPVRPGITPGSGPGHLALFGYDPIENLVGRGVLDILGTGVDLRPGDVAARLNFCSLDASGAITDRRAGRIPTSECQRLVALLNRELRLGPEQVIVHPVKEYRATLVLRGENLHGNVSDTDPQQVGARLLPAQARDARSQRVADLVNEFARQAGRILAGERPANGLLVRGIDRFDPLPTLQERFRLTPACIATYPMYRGVSKLVGMDVLDAGDTWATEIETLAARWNDYDFFFLHYKKTDSNGEDGNFEGKKSAFEDVDSLMARVAALSPMVLAVTGDHSTPSVMKAHSWHPVPLLLWGRYVFPDVCTSFGELAARSGGLGQFPTHDLMAQLLAHSLKLDKYGA
jgi:2,3-bisphosphoglycerate-independent phosphoglycerate mutase